ncbi:MAG: hypothetical protein JNK82_16745 [Myxococcaceae bacterium]|nr:hypothetical protein [Myxococcaceae bacterium]
MAKVGKDKDGKSALEAALRAYEAGDVVTARRTAARVVAGATADDQAAARKVAKALHGDDDKGEAQAELLAGELAQRTRPIARPYLWFLGGVGAYVGLLTLALVRYG